MFARKYMVGDKSTIGSSYNGQNMLKKGRQEKVFFYIFKNLPLYLLLKYSTIMLLNICKQKDSYEFGNHFRILSARMVQSAESAWTVLYLSRLFYG